MSKQQSKEIKVELVVSSANKPVHLAGAWEIRLFSQPRHSQWIRLFDPIYQMIHFGLHHLFTVKLDYWPATIEGIQLRQVDNSGMPSAAVYLEQVVIANEKRIWTFPCYQLIQLGGTGGTNRLTLLSGRSSLPQTNSPDFYQLRKGVVKQQRDIGDSIHISAHYDRLKQEFDLAEQQHRDLIGRVLMNGEETMQLDMTGHHLYEQSDESFGQPFLNGLFSDGINCVDDEHISKHIFERLESSIPDFRKEQLYVADYQYMGENLIANRSDRYLPAGKIYFYLFSNKREGHDGGGHDGGGHDGGGHGEGWRNRGTGSRWPFSIFGSKSLKLKRHSSFRPVFIELGASQISYLEDPYKWRLAKLAMSCSAAHDFWLKELIWYPSLIDRVTQAMVRQLAPVHPIRRFLQPFLKPVLAFNRLRKTHLSPVILDSLWSLTPDGLESVLSHFRKNFHWTNNELTYRPRSGEMIRYSSRHPPDPIAWHMLKWSQVRLLVQRLINHYYQGDRWIAEDLELLAWHGDLKAQGLMGAKTGLPYWTGRRQLIDWLTNWLVTVCLRWSRAHTNAPTIAHIPSVDDIPESLYQIFGYFGAPLSLRKDPVVLINYLTQDPEQNQRKFQKYLSKLLPSHEETLDQVFLTRFCAEYWSAQCELFKSYPIGLWADDPVFQKTLQKNLARLVEK